MSARPRGTVESAYDRWAEGYDSWPNPTRDLDAVVLRRQDLSLAGRDVLEIGCGTGKNTAWLGARARRVVAADLSAGMLARARRRVAPESVRYLRFDLTRRWPLAGACVDLVVDDLVLEHVENLGAVFTEACRVLRPGGELFVCELHPFRQLRGGQAQYPDPETGEPVLVPAYLHDVADYTNAALGAGFRVLHLGEWRDEGAPKAELPRLLSLHFVKA